VSLTRKATWSRRISGIRNRIRAVFGDNDGRDYMNETIEVLGFLTAIPGAVVFDSQQN